MISTSLKAAIFLIANFLSIVANFIRVIEGLGNPASFHSAIYNQSPIRDFAFTLLVTNITNISGLKLYSLGGITSAGLLLVALRFVNEKVSKTISH